jgi:hypothetical protein
MVNAKAIGKIQLWMGIVLLLGSIITGILIYNWYDNSWDRLRDQYSGQFKAMFEHWDTANLSNESKAIEAGFWINTVERAQISISEISIITGLFLGLTLIISLLFITQGLANMSKGGIK